MFDPSMLAKASKLGGAEKLAAKGAEKTLAAKKLVATPMGAEKLAAKKAVTWTSPK